DARADQADTLLTAAGHLDDGLAERVDAAMSHRAVHLALEAEAAPASAALADLEEGHVPVFGLRRLDRGDRRPARDVPQPALRHDTRRAVARSDVGQRAIGTVDDLVAVGNVHAFERRQRAQEALAVAIALAVRRDQLDDQLFALAHDNEVHERRHRL